MGKNRNRNIIRGKMANDEGLRWWVETIIALDDRVTKELAENAEDEEILTEFFKEAKEVTGLTRTEIETISRAILATTEFDGDTDIVRLRLENFLKNIYSQTMTVGGFSQLVQEMFESPEATDLCTKEPSMVQYIAVSWVLIKSVFRIILDSIPVEEESNPTTVVPPTVNPVVKEKPERVYSESDKKPTGHLMTADQEKRAVELGIPTKGNRLDLDAFYKRELDLIAKSKRSGKFVPVHELYGMTASNYTKWRNDVDALFADVIGEVIGSNKPYYKAEIVASRNIGKKKDEKAASIGELFKENFIKFIQELVVTASMVDDSSKVLMARDRLLDDPSMKDYMEELSKGALMSDSKELISFYKIGDQTEKFDSDLAIKMTMDLSNRTKKPAKEIFMYVALFLANDDAIWGDAVKIFQKGETLKRMDDGSIANFDLMMLVKKWVIKNTCRKDEVQPLSGFTSVFDVIKNAFEASGCFIPS